ASVESCGARIRLRKDIPVAAGLGGGSSDAAAVLLGLNELWGCGLDRERLAALAAELGADVPFCVYGGAARVTGIGERVEPLRPLAGVPIVLVPGTQGLASRDVYRAFDAAGGATQAQLEPALRALVAGDVPALAQALANDLEPVAVRLRPEIEAARRDLLAQGALGARMSGSGPTVFGLFADAAAAARACAALADRWPGVRQARLVAEGVGWRRENTTARGWGE
ncbi:MAG TPA: 4-(cytidine 5'-diphospho)-2-C-methyl-D-erythritol kinase, partial [Bacillota bacterium]